MRLLLFPTLSILSGLIVALPICGQPWKIFTCMQKANVETIRFNAYSYWVPDHWFNYDWRNLGNDGTGRLVPEPQFPRLRKVELVLFNPKKCYPDMKAVLKKNRQRLEEHLKKENAQLEVIFLVH
ncbi:hypothetical protein CC80DRAFT_502431 [Byssothecium circinans]|uniref:Uncharacterized protein n=1 Tax=Byssothecium circinans TaxID=147558 RepID=A0A6A5U2Q6_9PLEO|nr:hypothetical protein CC80DRAFT_502431 [Byssothecium circinans]